MAEPDLSAAYTFSHAWDVIDAQLFNNLDNPMDPGYQYGTAGFDRRNIAVVNFDYNLPIFKNSSGSPRPCGRMDDLRHRVMQSGNPLSVNSANDNLGFGGNTTNHADLVGPITYPHTFNQWFSPDRVRSAGPANVGQFSQEHRERPRPRQLEPVSVQGLPLHRKSRVQFRAETFNTWNHTQFTGVNNSVLTGNSSGPYNSTAGQINAIADPRVFQFGGKALLLGDWSDAPQPWRTRLTRFLRQGILHAETSGAGGSRRGLRPRGSVRADLTAIWPARLF